MIKHNQKIVLITCPDQKGIITKFTKLLYDFNVNILTMEEHVENRLNMFFLRMVLDISDIRDSIEKLVQSIQKATNDIGGKFEFFDKSEKVNTAIFVTKEQLPLYDLLIRHEIGQLNCNIKFILSNHIDLENVSNRFNIPFYHFPITSKTKNIYEPSILDLINQEKIELIVLARYMQILSPSFLTNFNHEIINIHHGFLPAFKGAKPYRQAWEKGVKLIGATAHYVTNDLDEGPIISQDVKPVNHTFSIKEMIDAGQDIERRVLTNAVRAHLERRIIVFQGRTIIFNR